jgi:hypothetical protein
MVLWLSRKFPTMTKKLGSENYKIKFFEINFLGTCFSLMSLANNFGELALAC